MVLVLLIALIVTGLIGVNYYNDHVSDKDKIKIKNPIKKEDPIKTYKASLIATGDGLIHSTLWKAAYNNETKTYDFSHMLTLTKEKVEDYDIVYYNQETVFGGESLGWKGFPTFNTPQEFGDAMIDAGFNMVSLSSNHSMDMGATGAKNSIEYWKSKSNVLTNGMASSESMRTDYQIKTANNITYTMLSYTYGTNGLGASALSSEPYLVNLYDEEKIKADIAAVRDKVDVLIVSMHWGNEYQTVASETQKNQAKFLSDNGVDIVLGTHSHCIQPWEKIGETIVFYSFGNFISNQMGAEQALVRKVGTVGMFATLDITKTVDTENDTTTIEIGNIGADLNYSYRYYNKDKGKNDYLVVPFSQMESKYLNNYESIYTEFSNILKTYDGTINIEPLPTITTN